MRDDEILVHPDQMTLGLVRTDHPDTSHEAAEAIGNVSTKIRADILTLLAVRPLTDQEIQAALGVNENTERPRRVELVRLGLVEDSMERRKVRPGSNRNAIVWRVRADAAGRTQDHPAHGRRPEQVGDREA